MGHFGTLCVLVMCAAPVAAQDTAAPMARESRPAAVGPASSDAANSVLPPGIVNPGLLVLSLNEAAPQVQRPPQEKPVLAQPPRPAQPRDGFQWRDAMKQYMTFLTFQHAWRLPQERTHSELGGPFWSDYVQSVESLNGWWDGDSLATNYLAHPMMGAVTGYIQIQNDPAGRYVEFGKSGAYWRSRAWAFAAAAIYSTQFELGPMSEASIGNVGLKPGTMAWVDLVMTPVGGLGWIVAEDAIDRYVISKIEGRVGRTKGRLLRTLLNPNRSVANLIRFEPPWKRDGRDLVSKLALRDGRPPAAAGERTAAPR